MANRAVVLDCRWLTEPRLAEINHIARLQLAVRRQGCQVQLRNADEALLDLIAFAGLAEVLRVEVRRESEEGEEPRGVEEKGQPGDPPV